MHANHNPSSNPIHLPMPLMRSVEQAVDLCRRDGDGFYLTAFALQAWLGQLLAHAAAEYAEKKDPRNRSLQSGQAAREFAYLFGQAKHGELRHLFACALRFTEYDDPLSDLLRSAAVALSIESEVEQAPQPTKPLSDSSANYASCLDVTSALSRLCDWVDSAVHWRIHEHWHLAPACFDPDPEKRELACLGTTQRHLGACGEAARTRWNWCLSDATQRFKDSVKWPTLGKAMCSESDRLWPYRQVDRVVIALWPLLKRHNWTYCDLLNLIRSALRPGLQHSGTPTLHSSFAYPCDREQSFATYCVNSLGLRKNGKGQTAKDGKPVGWEVAGKLIQTEVGGQTSEIKDRRSEVGG